MRGGNGGGGGGGGGVGDGRCDGLVVGDGIVVAQIGLGGNQGGRTEDRLSGDHGIVIVVVVVVGNVDDVVDVIVVVIVVEIIVDRLGSTGRGGMHSCRGKVRQGTALVGAGMIGGGG